MIQQSTFLGISLRARGRRRALVLGYYAFVLLLVAYPLYRHRFMPAAMIAQTFSLGSFFGGIRSSGVVKPYAEDSPVDPETRLRPISLNLSGQRGFSDAAMLDERELHDRDRAHFYAYRILCWSLGGMLALVCVTMNWTEPFFRDNAATLLWLLMVFALSLPQSVILWTEAEPIPETEMHLLPRAS